MKSGTLEDPLESIFVPDVAWNIRRPLPGTTFMGRIGRRLRSQCPFIREDTELGRRVLSAMNEDVPGTAPWERAFECIKTILTFFEEEKKRLTGIDKDSR